MKSFLFLVICIALCIPSIANDRHSRTPDWISAVSFGGTGSDAGNSIKTDKAGNRYVTGYFSSTARFGSKQITSVGGDDVFLAKFGRNGKLLWIAQAGGNGTDAGTGVDVDQRGNVYMTGWFTDNATFGSVRGSAKTVSGLGETIFIAKYYPSGRLAWVHTGVVADGLMNRGNSLAVEPKTGTVYVTGMAQMSPSFTSTDGGQYSVPGPWTWHMFLVKYDSAGNFKWGEWNEASPNSVASKVAVDEYNNAYVTGWFEDTTTFFSRNGHNKTIRGLSEPVQNYPDYSADAFLAKYDSNGNLKWVNQIGGYKADGIGIAISGGGLVSITGLVGNIGYGTHAQSVSIVTSQPGGKSINLGGGHYTNPFNWDSFVSTYNSNGILLSASRIGSTGHDLGSEMVYRGSHLYVTGIFEGTVKVGDKVLRGHNGTTSVFVLKYGPHGIKWATTAAAATSVDEEVLPAICITHSGSVLLTGAFTNTAWFGKVSLRSAGLEDIFFAELGKRGEREK